jgi:predicted nucleic-acid-binding Zn-ribbon protein
MENHRYRCPKCSNREYQKDQFRATGGMWAKIFDVQNKHFTTVTCTNCTYTEIYKVKSSRLENVFDLLSN